MTRRDILFDENLETSVYFEDLNKTVRLVLSDSLFAADEKLTEEYKTKISDFINCFSHWYGISIKAIRQRARNIYELDVDDNEIELMSIYILFEQDQPPLYGLGFRVEFDIEHGCGLKITGENYKIIEIGSADIAFC